MSPCALSLAPALASGWVPRAQGTGDTQTLADLFRGMVWATWAVVKGTSMCSNTEKGKASWGLSKGINYCLLWSCYCCLHCLHCIQCTVPMHPAFPTFALVPAYLSRESIDPTEALGFVCAPGAELGPLGCACVAGAVLGPLGWVREPPGRCWTPGAVHPYTGYGTAGILPSAAPGSRRRHVRPLLAELFPLAEP